MGTLTEGIVVEHSIAEECCTQSDHVMGAEKPVRVPKKVIQ